MKVLTDNPSKFSPEKLTEACYLINSGHRLKVTVDPCLLVSKARLLCLGLYSNRVISVGALKVPATAYVKSLLAEAHLSHMTNIPSLEIGWFVVDPIFRGMGLSYAMNKNLLSGITEPVIATATKTGRDHQLVRCFGFQKFSEIYSTVVPGARLDVLIRQRISGLI